MTQFANDQQHLHQFVLNCKQKAIIQATRSTSLQNEVLRLEREFLLSVWVYTMFILNVNSTQE